MLANHLGTDMVKLDGVQISEIIRKLSLGYSGVELARHYGVTPGRISQIKKKYIIKPVVTEERKTDELGNPIV